MTKRWAALDYFEMPARHNSQIAQADDVAVTLAQSAGLVHAINDISCSM